MICTPMIHNNRDHHHCHGNTSPTQKGQESYLASIKTALDISLCLRDFPSTLFEKDNKPYIEMSGYTPKLEPLIGKPIYLARNKKEQFLIEPAINSCRVHFPASRSALPSKRMTRSTD